MRDSLLTRDGSPSRARAVRYSVTVFVTKSLALPIARQSSTRRVHRSYRVQLKEYLLPAYYLYRQYTGAQSAADEARVNGSYGFKGPRILGS